MLNEYLKKFLFNLTVNKEIKLVIYLYELFSFHQ